MEFDPTLEWYWAEVPGFSDLIGPYKFTMPEDNIGYTALTLDERHANLGGVCHGGVLLSLADTSMGQITHILGKGLRYSTIQLESQFVSAAKIGQTLMAKSEQTRMTKDLSFMRCEIWGGGRCVMQASGIWKALNNVPQHILDTDIKYTKVDNG